MMLNRSTILDQANQRGFLVVLPNGDITGGVVYGFKLDCPVVHHMGGKFEISWDLAVRLARGEVTRVLA